MEVAVQTVHREQKRLPRLDAKGGDVAGVEKVLVGPQMDAAVANVAHERGSFVEGLNDRVPGGGGAELAQEDLFGIPRSQDGRSQRVGIGFEVAGAVRVVRHQNHRCPMNARVSGLISHDLLHHRLDLFARRRR